MSCGRATRSPAIASASVARSSRLSSSTGAFTSFQVSSSESAAAALGQAPLDGVEPQPDRLQRLDREPALVRPLAQRDAMPGDERGIEVARIVDAEIGEPRADPRLVDDAVARSARRGAGRAAREPTRRAPGRPSPSRARRGRRRGRARRGRSGRRGRRSAASSHGSRSRRDSPSNFVVSAKSSVSQGRLTPWPRTSVATQTSAAPVRKRSISSRRDDSGMAPYRTATRPGCRRFTSPASASTACG